MTPEVPHRRFGSQLRRRKTINKADIRPVLSSTRSSLGWDALPESTESNSFDIDSTYTGFSPVKTHDADEAGHCQIFSPRPHRPPPLDLTRCSSADFCLTPVREAFFPSLPPTPTLTDSPPEDGLRGRLSDRWGRRFSIRSASSADCESLIDLDLLPCQSRDLSPRPARPADFETSPTRLGSNVTRRYPSYGSSLTNPLKARSLDWYNFEFPQKIEEGCEGDIAPLNKTTTYSTVADDHLDNSFGSFDTDTTLVEDSPPLLATAHYADIDDWMTGSRYETAFGNEPKSRFSLSTAASCDKHHGFTSFRSGSKRQKSSLSTSNTRYSRSTPRLTAVPRNTPTKSESPTTMGRVPSLKAKLSVRSFRLQAYSRANSTPGSPKSFKSFNAAITMGMEELERIKSKSSRLPLLRKNRSSRGSISSTRKASVTSSSLFHKVPSQKQLAPLLCGFGNTNRDSTASIPARVSSTKSGRPRRILFKSPTLGGSTSGKARVTTADISEPRLIGHDSPRSSAFFRHSLTAGLTSKRSAMYLPTPTATVNPYMQQTIDVDVPGESGRSPQQSPEALPRMPSYRGRDCQQQGYDTFKRSLSRYFDKAVDKFQAWNTEKDLETERSAMLIGDTKSQTSYWPPDRTLKRTKSSPRPTPPPKDEPRRPRTAQRTPPSAGTRDLDVYNSVLTLEEWNRATMAVLPAMDGIDQRFRGMQSQANLGLGIQI